MMLDVISSGHILSDAQLLVRFHPSDLFQRPDGTLAIEDNNDDIKYLESTYGNLVKFWVPNVPHMDGDGQLSMKDMYEMADAINHSDIIIQEYSTLIMETAVFDKPVINVSMHDWEQNPHRGNAGLKIGQIITDYIAYNNN